MLLARVTDAADAGIPDHRRGSQEPPENPRLAPQPPPPDAEAVVLPSGSLAGSDYDEFAAALKYALRNFCRTDLLSRSPLLRSRLLPSGATTADLQTLLTRTAGELFNAPRDEKLRRVLELSYFRPASKQVAAAERLGLAFSTYRRHLAAARERLGQWLWEREHTAPSRAKHLSIIVLPFVNLSSEEGLGYLVDGITENLTTDLSRIPDMLVIDRNTAFSYQGKVLDPRDIGHALGVHYVMEGSVQAEGGRLRINAKLIDAGSGAQLWADRFDKPREKPFDVQDEITARLARSVDIQLVAAESRRVMGKDRNELNSADMTLRARAVWNRPFSLDAVREARRLYEAASRLDEHNLGALIGLADTHVREVAFYESENRQEQLRIAEAAEQQVARAMRLSPRDPMYPTWQLIVGIADLYLGRLDNAVAHLRQSVSLNRNCGWSQVALAVALAPRDQDDEQVARVSAEARRMAPSFTVAKFRSEALSRNPTYLSQRERFVAGLRRIGMPEE